LDSYDGTIKIKHHQDLYTKPDLGSVLDGIGTSPLELQDFLDHMPELFSHIHYSMHTVFETLHILYRRFCHASSKSQASCIAIDLIDMALRTSYFYILRSKYSANRSYELTGERPGSFYELGKSIVDELHSDTTPPVVRERFSRIGNHLPSASFESFFSGLEEKLGIHAEARHGLGFVGTCRLAALIRNKTRGHGMITKDLSSCILEPLMICLYALLHFLPVMQIPLVRKGEVYVVADEDVDRTLEPCVLHIDDQKNAGGMFFLQYIVNKKAVYLEYSSGEYIKPEIRTL
jgi:hypothetical protein